MAWQVWNGRVGTGRVGLSEAGAVWRGGVRYVLVWQVRWGQERIGVVRRGRLR